MSRINSILGQASSIRKVIKGKYQDCTTAELEQIAKILSDTNSQIIGVLYGDRTRRN